MLDFWINKLDFPSTRRVLGQVKCTKFIFGRGSARDPAGGVHDAPPDSLVRWGGGYPLPILHPLDAYSVSISAPRLEPPRLHTAT